MQAQISGKGKQFFKIEAIKQTIGKGKKTYEDHV